MLARASSLVASAWLACACAPPAAADAPDHDQGAPAEAASGGNAPAPPAFQAIVSMHNELRAKHCAPPLSWSADLAREAQAWADTLAKRGCNLEHSTTPHGENLAAATAGSLEAGGAVRLWYAERDKYDFKAAKFSMKAGHFTQLVWVDTRRVGCGTTRCADKEVWVCNYDPAGNVQGQFSPNVLPTTCKH